jgi:protein phosphatase PTC7
MKARKFRGAVIDSPSEAETYETKLRDGDLVIAYVHYYSNLQFLLFADLVLSQTDGLSDNVFPTEIIAICSLVARAGGSEDEQVQTMADRIVHYARQCMVNRRRVSPFESAFAYPPLFRF